MLKNKTLLGLMVGTLAGAIDIIPGVIKGVDIRVTLAGFTFWLSVGLVVAHVTLPMKDGLKGLIVALVLSTPGMILLSLVDADSVLPMLIITILLGPAVGYVTGRCLGRHQG